MSLPSPSVTPRGTVLLVDDEALLRHVLARCLTDAGFDVIEAEDGQAALAALSSCRDSLQLVITDINMPGMDGVEFAREFRPLCPRVPILFITGRETGSLNGPRLDPDELLLKPFGPDVFLQRVVQMLAREFDAGRPSA